MSEARPEPIVRPLTQRDYLPTWQAMRDFTDQRTPNTADEFWLIEHPPVFTLGQAGKAEHLLNPGDIPIVQSDRGGQVTYHGPGQLIVYVLLDLKRHKLGVRALVTLLEESLIDLLRAFDLSAQADPKAPGVYIDGKKIAALGLRIRKHCSYHGLSLNVDMDLEPFQRINPCGYSGLQVTQIANFCQPPNRAKLGDQLLKILAKRLDLTLPIAPELSASVET